MPNTRKQNNNSEAQTAESQESQELRKAIEPPNFKITRQQKTKKTVAGDGQIENPPFSANPAGAEMPLAPQSSSLSAASASQSSSSSSSIRRATQPNIYGHAHKI